MFATSENALELMAERSDAILAAARADEETEMIEARTTTSSGLRLVALKAR